MLLKSCKADRIHSITLMLLNKHAFHLKKKKTQKRKEQKGIVIERTKMAGINLPRFSLSPKSGSKSRVEMLFNSLSPSVKPILYPLEICNRQDRLFLFPKPATPSQKLLSTGVSPIACAKLPSNFKTQRHFVLVHGACHGAWCWYKVSAQLKSAGHNVTALDMAASGVHPKQVHELHSFEDYFEPLMEFMESLPPEERVVLVGHSMSGICISVAMERFPEKISAAVFAAAVMPGPDLSFKAIAEKVLFALPPLPFKEIASQYYVLA